MQRADGERQLYTTPGSTAAKENTVFKTQLTILLSSEELSRSLKKQS